MALNVNNSAASPQADRAGVGHRFQRAQRIFPNVSLDQFCSHPLFELVDRFFFRSFCRVDPRSDKVEPFGAEFLEQPDCFPINQLIRSLMLPRGVAGINGIRAMSTETKNDTA